MEKNKEGTYIEIDKELISSIKDYCKINDLKLTEYINSLLKKAFMVEKYGEAPPFLTLDKQESSVKPETVPQTVIEEKKEEEIEIKPKIKKRIKTY